jgi:hypothetical protein
MSSDPKAADEKYKSKEYLQRVDYGYAFHLTGGIYQTQADHTNDEIDKNESTDPKNIPIIVNIEPNLIG